ncbi:MAG: hypothetical protein LUB56_00585 [Coprobacillus sp.]|nr:hypothetical protein [Coprobacillus sp.]
MAKDNYKEMISIIKEISITYFFYQDRVRRSNNGMLGSTNLEDAKSYIQNTNQAFNQLTDEEKDIINNEFFYQDYADWWIKKYSRGDFQKKKKIAMHQFINYFSEVNNAN